MADVTRIDSPVEAADSKESPSPLLAVLACSRPIADPRPYAELVERLGAEQVVQLLGVWCEGEGRTGRVLDGVERVFWHAWPSWVEQRFATPEVVAKPIASVIVESADKALVDAVAAELTEQQVATRWARPGRSADTPCEQGDVWLFDAAQLGGHEANRLADACAKARRVDARVVVLLDFPRPETFDAALAIGATAVVAKPFGRVDLLDAIGIRPTQSDVLREVA